MRDGKKLILNNVEQTEVKLGVDLSGDKTDAKEVKDAQLSVNTGVNVLGNSAEVVMSNEVSENESKSKNTYSGGSGVVSKADANGNVTPLPNIEVMIAQTVQAIENELKIREEEITSMLRNRNSSPYEVNDLVRRVRFLNGLLSQLKRAAKLAEDFVLGLWKQFVNKA